MKVMLTGATGFLGARIYDALTGAGHETECVPSRFVKGKPDLTELSRIAEHSDVIVHTAAISDTGYSQEHPDESYTANVELPRELAKIAQRYGCKLISCSSDQVYNGKYSKEPHTEDETPEPFYVYGRHKLEAEKIISDICPSGVSLRLTWMYDVPAYRVKTNVGLPLFLLKATSRGEKIKWGAGDFRGITYAREVAENIPLLFGVPGGVYNFGSENTLDMYETALGFLDAMGLSGRKELVVKSEDYISNLSMDCSKARKNGIAFSSTSDGIKKLVSDYPSLF